VFLAELNKRTERTPVIHNLQNESSWYWRTKRLVLKFSRECFNIFVWPVGSKHWTKLFKYWTNKLVVLAAAANQLVPCSKQCDFFQITCQDCIILSFMTKLVIYIFFFLHLSLNWNLTWFNVSFRPDGHEQGRKDLSLALSLKNASHENQVWRERDPHCSLILKKSTRKMICSGSWRRGRNMNLKFNFISFIVWDLSFLYFK